ncbi:polysaccharide pyruvyl transferase family protein [Sodalis sp. dw_96]|uniref:polysaccharide pyruvyl transferase family protein n=1 Tax=Sodalis sp. dw_96 TaxID=2719794 RepID=UPI001BD25A24|nr:polysaccharide pyruvyl transferase family protein [Sodalis sp. dw_96]
MAKTVLLINDTEDVYHWGCYGTSHAIKDKLHEKGAKEILTVSVYEVHNLKNIPNSLLEFGEQNTFITEYPEISQKMKSSDIIVINGEGTIHDFTPYSKALLFLIYAGKTFFNKKTVLINHSCFPNTIDADAISYYKAAYNCCDFIAARETYSVKIINEILNKECFLAFDSLPLTIKSIHYNLNERRFKESYICISGAVNYDFDRSKMVAKRLLKEFPHHKYLFLSGSKEEGIHFEDAIAFESLKEYIPGMELYGATSFSDWVSVIKYADLLISGRYHYTIGALCVGTPTVYFPSNTPKIDAIVKDLKLPKAIYNKSDFIFNLQLIFRIKQAKYRNWKVLLEKLCILADKNYEWDL